MTVVNFISKGDKVATYLRTITALSDIFGTSIYNGKPIKAPRWKFMYFQVIGNSEKIGDDSYGKGTASLYKRATVEFFIVNDSKTDGDVVMGEYLDILSNALIDNVRLIDLDGFEIKTVSELSQSGVIRLEEERPFIVAGYDFIYKSYYG